MAMGVSLLLNSREKKLPFLAPLADEAVLLAESVADWLAAAEEDCGDGSMDLTLAMNSFASLQSVNERPTMQFCASNVWNCSLAGVYVMYSCSSCENLMSYVAMSNILM